MHVKDLTTQELQNLIRLTVIETLDDYLTQAEDQSELTKYIQKQLLKIRANRQKKDEKISAAEAYQLVDSD